jgi:ribosomal protein S18 acetylase RimI-like enzyme
VYNGAWHQIVVERKLSTVTEVVRLSEHPGRLAEARSILRGYLLLPDVWEVLGQVPEQLPDFFVHELEQFPSLATPPAGEVVVALGHSDAVGIGEVVPLSGDTCELKRVHVVADHEGSGIGRLIARSLLDEACRLGYRSVVLDVLPTRTRARALWTSVGFEEIEPYRVYPLQMVFMGQVLR